MKVVRPGDDEYDADRAISNARFDLHPSAIYCCEDARDVVQVIEGGHPGAVRVRSGGHQHEGMCSGDSVLPIDLSRMNSIEQVRTSLRSRFLCAARRRISIDTTATSRERQSIST
jgi:hypothetical protein